MATAVGDILELTLNGTFNAAVATRNVFHYQVSNLDIGGDTPFENAKNAARDFWNKIRLYLTPMVSSVQRFQSIKAVWLNGADAGVQNLYLIPNDEQAGLLSGDAMPPYVAHGYRYQGSGGAERNGYKRFAGVTEAQNAAGIFSGSGADADNLAGKLGEEIQVSGDAGGVVGQFDLRTVIVKKMAGGLDPSDIVVIDSWEPVGIVYTGLTTQNTRKFGRGI